MKQKAKQCDQCNWFATNPNNHVCRLGHFPMFFKPQTHIANWGWKRVCEDFKQKDGK